VSYLDYLSKHKKIGLVLPESRCSNPVLARSVMCNAAGTSDGPARFQKPLADYSRVMTYSTGYAPSERRSSPLRQSRITQVRSNGPFRLRWL
jgi:hypothetical protein